MADFPLHTPETAPAEARPVLEAAQQAFGFIPNLMAVMASSPALAEAYLTLSGLFEKTDLTTTEKQVVLLTVSHYHACHYCMAAHSALAAMQNLPADVVEALRNDQPIADPKLQALRALVLSLVENRGWPDDAVVSNFLDAGYQPAHIMDVLVGVAQKTLSNFTNHIAGTPLDKAFSEYAWTPPAR